MKEDIALRRLAGQVRKAVVDVEKAGGSYIEAREVVMVALGRLAGEIVGDLAAHSQSPDETLLRQMARHESRVLDRARDEVTLRLVEREGRILRRLPVMGRA